MDLFKTWNEPWTDIRPKPDVGSILSEALLPYAYYDAEYGQPKNIGYVELSGVSGDYVWTTDSSALDIAGNIEIVCRIKPTNWTAAANQTICGKYITTGNQRSFRAYISTTGSIVITASVDGTVVTSATIVPTVAFVDNTWYWLRIRLQLTNGANSIATLETAPGNSIVEPTSWTANGSQTAAIIASVFNSTAPFEIGTFAAGTLERFTGQISRVILRNGFAGAVLADFDASLSYLDGYTDAYNNVWTVANAKVYDISANNRAPLVNALGTNAATPLSWRERPVVKLPGVAGNDITSTRTALSVASWECAVKVRLNVIGVAQRLAGSQSTMHQMNLGSTNVLNIAVLGPSPSFVTIGGASSIAVPGLAAGVDVWLRGRVTAASALCEYWYSYDSTDEYDNVTWISLSSAVGSNAGTVPASVDSNIVRFGSNSSGLDGFAGELIAGVQFVDGGGRREFRAALMTSQSGYTDGAGNVWAVNRTASGRKSVVQSYAAASNRSMFMLGTDDYLTIPIAAVPLMPAAGSATAVVVYRAYGNQDAAAAVALGLGGYNTVQAGLAIRIRHTGTTTSIAYVSDGAGVSNPSAGSGVIPDLTARIVAAAILTPSAITSTANGQTGTPTGVSLGDRSLITDGAIGASAPGTNYHSDMEWEAVLLFARVLTASEIAQIVSYYRGGV